MKKSINWHKDCLKNQQRSIYEKRVLIDKLIEQRDKQVRRHNLYTAQVNLAVKEGKDCFDSEKFAIKRLYT